MRVLGSVVCAGQGECGCRSESGSFVSYVDVNIIVDIFGCIKWNNRSIIIAIFADDGTVKSNLAQEYRDSS